LRRFRLFADCSHATSGQMAPELFSIRAGLPAALRVFHRSDLSALACQTLIVGHLQ
jgi:hypothetical protein